MWTFQLKGVARGLIYIHDQDLVHGDLKGVRLQIRTIVFPFLLTSIFLKANILIDQFGNALLADFGMATNVPDPENPLSSSSNDRGGTVRWMSPELMDPERFGYKKITRTKASDCYAFAMVIYEVISGHLPFQGRSSFAVSIMVMEGTRPGRETGFPDAIWDMLEFCWVDRPRDRPSVNDVLQCLEDVSYLRVSSMSSSSPAGEATTPYYGVFYIFTSSSRDDPQSDYP